MGREKELLSLPGFETQIVQHVVLVIHSSSSSSSSSPFTPCGEHGIDEERPGIAISSYSLDLILLL
jgi:hypothetical protein